MAGKQILIFLVSKERRAWGASNTVLEFEVLHTLEPIRLFHQHFHASAVPGTRETRVSKEDLIPAFLELPEAQRLWDP
jgi:hypothetical protein